MYEIKQNIIYDGCFPFKVLYSDNPHRMNAHWHSQIEFMYFYETNGCEYKCKDKKINVQCHDLIVANSAEIHECLDFNDSVVCCVIADLKMLGEYSDVIFKNLIRNDTGITLLFDKLAGAVGKKSFNLMCAGCIYEIFSVLTEKYILYDTSERKKDNRILLHKTIGSVLSLIENSLSENLSVDTLAAAAHLSPGRFAHVFKEYTGASPGEYVEKARLSLAMRLLGNTDLGISEIAYKCGFSDHSYFAYRFKRYTGLSPRDFRKAGGV